MYTAPNMNDPIDKLAHFLSEHLNDNAPIGWGYYRGVAEDIKNVVMEKL